MNNTAMISGLVLAAAVLAGPVVPASAEAEDPASRCLAIAGLPDAGAPPGAGAQAAYLAALAEARPYCAEAAAQGDGPALYHLAMALAREGAHARAVEALQQAAGAGVAAALTRLGDYANFGTGPVAEDHAQAVAYYRAAAEQGDLAAVTSLAFMHRYGRGVQRDPARMVALMADAAEGGYHFAQYRLAQVYRRGDGIPGGADAAMGIPDGGAAARLYRMAALQGNGFAALELAELYADDRFGVAADDTEQARWLTMAAEAGQAQALAMLGVLHEQGRGVAQDPRRAAELYIAALESGVRFDVLRLSAQSGPPRWERATAMAFQEMLRDMGHYRGAIDGIVGGGTAAAAGAVTGE